MPKNDSNDSRALISPSIPPLLNCVLGHASYTRALFTSSTPLPSFQVKQFVVIQDWALQDMPNPDGDSASAQLAAPANPLLPPESWFVFCPRPHAQE